MLCLLKSTFFFLAIKLKSYPWFSFSCPYFKYILKFLTSFCLFCYNPAPSHHSVLPGQLCKLPGGPLASILATPESLLCARPVSGEPRSELVILLRPAQNPSTPFSAFRVEPKRLTVSYLSDTIRLLLGPFLPASSTPVALPFILFLCVLVSLGPWHGSPLACRALSLTFPIQISAANLP